MTELIKLIRELAPTLKTTPVVTTVLAILLATFARQFGDGQPWQNAMMQVGALGFVISIAGIFWLLFKPQIGPVFFDTVATGYSPDLQGGLRPRRSSSIIRLSPRAQARYEGKG